MNDLAQRIRQARKDAGLSHDRFAEALDVSARTCFRWEAGETAPRHRVLGQIADVTGKPVSFFVDGVDASDLSGRPATTTSSTT